MTSSIYTANEFWTTFHKDLAQARARVIIQSPFVTSRRLRFLSKDFVRLTKQGVVLCVFIQQPQELANAPQILTPELALSIEKFGSAITLLESWNIHVNIRPQIHGKLAVIDDNILWEGSLNILSHRNTKEHMRRWRDHEELCETVLKHDLLCSECVFNRKLFSPTASQPKAHVQLGHLLAAHRIRLKLTQRELAQRCGLPHSSVAHIEAGRNVTFNTLLRISKYLKLEPVLIPKSLSPAVTNFLRQHNTEHDLL